MGEKKSWNIKGLFVQQDETDKEETAPAAPSAYIPRSPTVTPTTTYTSSTPAGNPTAFEGQLREVVNGCGSEYVKFKGVCEELRTVLPDENTRLKSAFVSMRAMGVTKDILTSTAKLCLDTISQEASEFETAMKAAYTEQVEGGAGRVTSFDRQIEEKLSQITSLQSEVDKLRTDKGRISGEIEQSRNKIDSARRDFTAAYNKLINEINSDINKINSSL